MLPLEAAQEEQLMPPTGWLFRAIGWVYRSRRKFATGATAAVAVLLAWHAVFGSNGVLMYRAKRMQAAGLENQITSLQKENARLAEHNQRLQQDPHAIEGAIRGRLRYARPNEVIVQVDDAASPAKP